MRTQVHTRALSVAMIMIFGVGIMLIIALFVVAYADWCRS